MEGNDRDGNAEVQHGDEAALHEPQHRTRPETAVAPSAAASAPTHADDAKAQAEKILKRNRELIDGDAEAGPEGEREVGVGHTVNSDSSHHGGDYASD